MDDYRPVHEPQHRCSPTSLNSQRSRGFSSAVPPRASQLKELARRSSGRRRRAWCGRRCCTGRPRRGSTLTARPANARDPRSPMCGPPRRSSAGGPRRPRMREWLPPNLPLLRDLSTGAGIGSEAGGGYPRKRRRRCTGIRWGRVAVADQDRRAMPHGGAVDAEEPVGAGDGRRVPPGLTSGSAASTSLPPLVIPPGRVPERAPDPAPVRGSAARPATDRCWPGPPGGPLCAVRG